MTLNLTIKELHIHIQHADIAIAGGDEEALAKIQALNQQVEQDTASMQNAVNQNRENL